MARPPLGEADKETVRKLFRLVLENVGVESAKELHDEVGLYGRERTIRRWVGGDSAGAVLDTVLILNRAGLLADEAGFTALVQGLAQRRAEDALGQLDQTRDRLRRQASQGAQAKSRRDATP